MVGVRLEPAGIGLGVRVRIVSEDAVDEAIDELLTNVAAVHGLKIE